MLHFLQIWVAERREAERYCVSRGSAPSRAPFVLTSHCANWREKPSCDFLNRERKCGRERTIRPEKGNEERHWGLAIRAIPSGWHWRDLPRQRPARLEIVLPAAVGQARHTRPRDPFARRE